MARHSAFLLLVLVSLLAISLVPGSLPQAAANSDPFGNSRPAATFSAPANYIVLGAHISPVPTYPMEIRNFENRVGRTEEIIMYFNAWDRLTEDPYTHAGPCDNGFLPRQVDFGAPPKPGMVNGHVIMITWEPLTGFLGTPGPAAYDNVLNHQYDSLIDACANELKAWSNKTFLIRFMHEMNIADEDWWAGQPYNRKPDGTGDTDKFKQVWRYVWQRFHDLGVTNVQWVWSPNFASNPGVAWNNMNNYYPGDQYVDWIGLSGYNWMGPIAFQSYSFLFDAVLTDLQCRYAKPIMHAEIGSAPYSNSGDSPPTKEGWIADAFQRAQTFPLVRAFVWFNDYAEHNVTKADFRVVSTTDWQYLGGHPQPVPDSVTNAYANAIADNSFTSSYNSSQLLNPPMTRCPGDAVSGNGVLSARPTSIMVGRTGGTTASFSIGAFGLSSGTQFTISGCPNGASCRFASSGSSTSGTLAAPWSGDVVIVTANPSTALGAFTLTIRSGGTLVQIQVTVVQRILRHYLVSVLR